MRFQTLFEGRWFFGGALGLAVLGILLGWTTLTGPAVGLFIFCLIFFRDPERTIPPGDDVVISTADGVVTDIVEMEEKEYLKQTCIRVGVFLSVVDVHVNRAPIAGKIVYVRHNPGEFLDARSPECSARNEAMTWAFQGAKATLVVRQITGAIARRIVPWSKLDDTVEKGHRFGMIRFGSRTEVYLPLGTTVAVKIGETVRGGSTVLATLQATPSQPAA